MKDQAHENNFYGNAAAEDEFSKLEGGACQLIRAAVELLQDGTQRAKLSAAAREWHAGNRGATERTLGVIRSLLRG